jgi:carbamoyl-phosphate synthase large subunit
LVELGFDIVATQGTAKELKRNGLKAESVYKVGEGRPNVVDGIKNGDISLVINTPYGAMARYDEEAIGRASIQKGIVAITTLSAASAAIRALRSSLREKINVKSLQEHHA